MTFEDLVKLAEMYQGLKNEETITDEQVPILEVAVFIKDTIGATFDDRYFEHINLLTTESFRKIGANEYANLIESYINKYIEIKKPKSLFGLFTKNKQALELNSEFLNKLNTLLETDDLVKNYVKPYVKANNLEKDLKHYNKFLSVKKEKEKNTRKVKRNTLIFASLLSSTIIFFVAPCIIALIDFGADGNTFNANTTIVRFIAFGVSIVLSIILTMMINTLERKFLRIAFYIALPFVILFATVFIEPNSSFVSFMISGVIIAFVCYYAKNKKFKQQVVNDKSITKLLLDKN